MFIRQFLKNEVSWFVDSVETGLDHNAQVVEPNAEVAAAFERLLSYPGLPETTDAKCQCNVVEGLLNEVKTRTGLLSEWHVTNILSKRYC